MIVPCRPRLIGVVLLLNLALQRVCDVSEPRGSLALRGTQPPATQLLVRYGIITRYFTLSRWSTNRKRVNT
jgi:hypothetical protein